MALAHLLTESGDTLTAENSDWLDIEPLQYTLDSASGGFALTGNAAAFSIILSASPGAFNLAGGSAGFSISKNLAAATGVFSETGNPAALLEAHLLTAASGAFNLAGGPAGFSISKNLAAATGVFSETGNPAALLEAHLLAGVTGTFTETAGTAEFILTTGQPILEADTGIFVLDSPGAALIAPAQIVETGGGSIIQRPVIRIRRRFLIASGSAGEFLATPGTAALKRDIVSAARQGRIQTQLIDGKLITYRVQPASNVITLLSIGADAHATRAVNMGSAPARMVAIRSIAEFKRETYLTDDELIAIAGML